VSRFVDRGAVVAALVGFGMAVTIAVSFLLVIPIEPVYWYLTIPAGLLIGYYANARSLRAGEWVRTFIGAAFAALVTGVTFSVLLLGTKALFFAADDGFRDPGLGGRITCQTGADCVYQRYLEGQGDALTKAGVTDAASFSTFYWGQQWSTAGSLVMVTTAAGLVGGGLYGLTRGRRRPDGATEPAA